MVWRRTCPGRDCHKAPATDEEIAAERAAGTWRGPRWCPPCAERDEHERAERERERREAEERAVEARRREVKALEEWARDVLADPDTAIMDTVIRAETCLTSESASGGPRSRFTPTRDAEDRSSAGR